MAWGVMIFLYSLAGSLVLLTEGKFLFFVYPEWYIYGGIGMAVAVLALLNVIALSNRSYTWTRACKFLWPFVIVICAIRVTIMIVQLHRGKDKITWECENGGQIWATNAEYNTTRATLPAGFCTSGQSTLVAAFAISLLVDVVCQLYIFFLTWRFQKRLEHYKRVDITHDW